MILYLPFLDNDKENDNRSALATQAVIQRRRKPKRRSTGVVHIDMDVSWREKMFEIRIGVGLEIQNEFHM